MTRLFVGPASVLFVVLAALAVLCLLGGCGGGGDDGGGNPPSGGDTATVRGTVVQADSVTGGLGGATVQALGFGAAGVDTAQSTILVETTADSQGNFVLPNIPVGDVTIAVSTPNESNYGSQSIPDIHLNRDDDIRLTIAVLPTGSAPPTIVYLSPTSAKVDLFGQVSFTGSVASSSGGLAVTPSFYLTGEIGSVDRNGRFTATAVGTGKLWAISGTARTSANIEVVEAHAPQITSFFVAPRNLSAAGGNVSITVAANDGDGIAQVRAEVYRPDGSIANVLLELDPRTTETYWLPETMDALGAIGRWLVIPANDNTPDVKGHQESQRYSVHVIVTDTTGVSTENEFVFITVAGIDEPPSPF